MPTTDGFGALVAESGICFGVDLATPTASPPPGSVCATRRPVGPTDAVALLPAGVEH
jgi:hypothetical protein